MDAVARASSGLPVGERRKYIAPLRRRVTEIDRLEEELRTARASTEVVSELGAEEPEPAATREQDLVETLERLLGDLERYDEHLQGRSATVEGRRRFRR